ncbi:hypothetical protein H2203_008051 [Taxawa tesnikishii (nom. ined.)]|nr:hypothetical protein H2203_008051 [Dothideales sp. JES 119]
MTARLEKLRQRRRYRRKSTGGPVGGWFADTIGWRWSFYGQCPLTMLGLVLILWKIPDKTTKADDLEEATTLARKLKRIDVLGAVVLASAISAFLLALDFAAKEAPWWHVLISALLALFLTTIFYFVEQRWAAEPILPIKLITKRAAFTSYLIAGFQIAAQFSLFYAVPIYFQIAGEPQFPLQACVWFRLWLVTPQVVCYPGTSSRRPDGTKL